MHRTDNYLQHSSIVWPVWLNGRVFVYELSGCGFESHCSHLKTLFLAVVLAPVPFLFYLHTFCFLYTKVKLTLVLIYVQCIQNVIFSFRKGSNRQNHSSSDSHLLITPQPPPSKISYLPNTKGYLENPGWLTHKLQLIFFVKI